MAFHISLHNNIRINLSATHEVPLTWWAIDTDLRQSAWEWAKKEKGTSESHIYIIRVSKKHLSTGLCKAWGMSTIYEKSVLVIKKIGKNTLHVPVYKVELLAGDVCWQLYAFHQCCQRWPVQHTQAGLKCISVSTLLDWIDSPCFLTATPNTQPSVSTSCLLN